MPRLRGEARHMRAVLEAAPAPCARQEAAQAGAAESLAVDYPRDAPAWRAVPGTHW